MSENEFNRRHIFWLSVLALFTAAASSSLRAAIAGSLKEQWIDPFAPQAGGELIGSALGAAFLGFAVTLFISSAAVDQIGMRRMLFGSGLCFFCGTLMIAGAGTVTSGMSIYTVVWSGMLLSGIGWGLAESAINPLTARIYPEEATHRLNLLHAWYPGGLIAGGLAGYWLTPVMPWQAIIALALVPAVGVMALAITTRFPPPMLADDGVSFRDMITEVFRRPSFFLWFGAMFLTAASELAPGQWLDVALSHRVGMRGILLLVYVSALMFVFRHFAGRVAGHLSNPGLLFISSALAALGLFMLSRAEGPTAAIIASTVWGLGVCAMWPTMLASVAERYPRGGAWAMGLVGSAGALSIYLVLPRLGALYDQAKINLAGGQERLATLSGEPLRQIENAAASSSFAALAIVPLLLLFVFGGLWLAERSRPIPKNEEMAGGAA